MTPTHNSPPHTRPMARPLFLRLIHTAIRLEHMSFARQACLSWLATFPVICPPTCSMRKSYCTKDTRSRHCLS